MTIRAVADTQNTNFMSEEEIDALVTDIVVSLDSSKDGYIQASQTYGYFFFQDESSVFKQKLCSALSAHFPQFKNAFWIKAAV